MKRFPNPSKNAIIWLLLSAVLMTALYVSLIFNRNIWTDEAFTIELVGSNSVLGIIRGTANDVHPPLYYLIVKLFITLFGTSFQVYKLVSILPMFFTMLLGIFYIAPWFGAKTAFLFMLFLNAIPCVMEYGVQIRMYSWAIFFITIAGLFAYGAYVTHQTKYWILLSIAAVSACYTHNFAMISAVWIYLLLGAAVLFSRTGIGKCFLSGAFTALCFIPWLLVLLKQTGSRINNYWIEPVTKETILGYFGDLFDSRLPFTAIMFAFLLLAAFIMVFVKPYPATTRCFALALLLVPLLTALLGIAVSVLITPFFIARYLIPCMGLTALFLAIGFGTQKGLSYPLLCAFLLSMTASSYKTNFIDEYRSTHTEELLTYMEENLSENDIILYNNKLYGFIYACYFDTDKLRFLEDMDFGAASGTIWYFDSCISPWLPDAVLQEHGLTKEYIATLGIEQNDFILYRISR